MTRRRRLGQHFLRSPAVARAIAGRAGAGDAVLEIGTGRGALTGLLAGRAARVVSVEADAGLHREAAARLSAPNLELRHGDGFAEAGGFTLLVSSLPYSQSRRAVEWLAQNGIPRAVLVVQAEFADKVCSPPPAARRAVSVVAGHCFRIRRLGRVGRGSFDPPPAVDSEVIELERRAVMPARTVAAVNRIFSYRRKTVRGALGHLGVGSGDRRRLGELSDGEIVGLAGLVAG